MINYFQIYLSLVVLSALFLMEASAQSAAGENKNDTANPDEIQCFVCNSLDDADCKKSSKEKLETFKTLCKGDYFKKLYGDEKGAVGSSKDKGWGGVFPGNVTVEDAKSHDGFVQNFITDRVFIDKDEEVKISEVPKLCRKIETKLKKAGAEQDIVIRGCAWGEKEAKIPRRVDSGEQWGTDIFEDVCKNKVADEPCNNGNVLKSILVPVFFVTSFSLFFH